MSKTYRRLPDDFGREKSRHRRPEEGFLCRRCHEFASVEAPGTGHRNHCPRCLWSVHVDDRPGDRASPCGGGMEPIAIWVRPSGEWALVHRCGTCHGVRVNRIAGDDAEAVLLSLAARPMAQPPFPVERLPWRR